MLHRLSTVLFGAVLLGLASCGGGKVVTEIVVRIDTTFRFPCDFDTIDVDVPGYDGGTGQPVTFTEADMDKLPLELTLVKGPVPSFEITIRAMKDGEVVAAQPVALTFVDGKSKLAKVSLKELCGTECDTLTIPGANLLDYVPSSATHGPEDCSVEPEVCEPACSASQECVDGKCVKSDTLRYKLPPIGMPSAFVGTANACDQGGSVQLGPTGGNAELTDSNSIMEITLPTADDADGKGFDIEFYKRKVTKMWVSTRGWISFEDPGTLNTVTGLPLDDDAVPPGVYAFWDDIKFGSAGSTKACYTKIGTGVIVSWNVMCFGDTAPASCNGLEDKLSFSIVLEKSSLGTVHVIYLTNHGSKTQWKRGSTGSDDEGNQVIIGVKGFGDANCSVDECKPDGVCMTGNKPCGFTPVPNPVLYFNQVPTESSFGLTEDQDITFKLQ